MNGTSPEADPPDPAPAPPGGPPRARVWFTQARMVAAAALCPLAIWVDGRLRFDWINARPVTLVEAALVLYGLTCAIVGWRRGGLDPFDRAVVGVCLVVFAATAYVAAVMERVVHN